LSDDWGPELNCVQGKVFRGVLVQVHLGTEVPVRGWEEEGSRWKLERTLRLYSKKWNPFFMASLSARLRQKAQSIFAVLKKDFFGEVDLSDIQAAVSTLDPCLAKQIQQVLKNCSRTNFKLNESKFVEAYVQYKRKFKPLRVKFTASQIQNFKRKPYRVLSYEETSLRKLLDESEEMCLSISLLLKEKSEDPKHKNPSIQ